MLDTKMMNAEKLTAIKEEGKTLARKLKAGTETAAERSRLLLIMAFLMFNEE